MSRTTFYSIVIPLAVSLGIVFADLNANCAPVPAGMTVAVNCIQAGCPDYAPLASSEAYSHDDAR